MSTPKIVFQGRYNVTNEITIGDTIVRPNTILFAKEINPDTIIFRFFSQETKRFLQIEMDQFTQNAAGLIDAL